MHSKNIVFEETNRIISKYQNYLKIFSKYREILDELRTTLESLDVLIDDDIVDIVDTDTIKSFYNRIMKIKEDKKISRVYKDLEDICREILNYYCKLWLYKVNELLGIRGKTSKISEIVHKAGLNQKKKILGVIPSRDLFNEFLKKDYFKQCLVNIVADFNNLTEYYDLVILFRETEFRNKLNIILDKLDYLLNIVNSIDPEIAKLLQKKYTLMICYENRLDTIKSFILNKDKCIDELILYLNKLKENKIFITDLEKNIPNCSKYNTFTKRYCQYIYSTIINIKKETEATIAKIKDILVQTDSIDELTKHTKSLVESLEKSSEKILSSLNILLNRLALVLSKKVDEKRKAEIISMQINSSSLIRNMEKILDNIEMIFTMESFKEVEQKILEIFIMKDKITLRNVVDKLSEEFTLEEILRGIYELNRKGIIECIIGIEYE